MKTFSETKSIRCAAIGYGGAFNMGRTHLSEMASAGMTPVAVAEIDPERLKAAEVDFPGIATYGAVAEMLEKAKPDLVAIITPHNTHAELAIQCLRGGSGAVCEKPMAITLEECDRMIDAAQANDRLLSVYHNRHWDGCILEALEHIQVKKQIGEVFRLEATWGRYGNPGDWWRTSRSISGGIHYDWGVHLLEYAMQIVKSDAIEVTAFSKEGYWQGKWGADTNQDEMSVIVRFASGTLFNLRVTTLDAHPDSDHPIQLVTTGTKGKYYMDLQGFSMYHESHGEIHKTTGRNRPDEGNLYYENIAEAMTGKAKKLIITPEWSRRTIEVLEFATRSAQEQRSLRLR